MSGQANDPAAPAGEEFLTRWSRLKRRPVEEELPAARPEAVETGAEPPLTDADMPPLESLSETSDFSGFLSPEVSEELRRLALRKLFHSALFNTRDGLDDYDDDFTSFEKLGDLITSEMRHRMEQEAKRLAEITEEGETTRAAEEAEPDPVQAEAEETELPDDQDDMTEESV